MSKILMPVLFALAFAFSGVAVAKAVPKAPLVTVHRAPSGRCLGAVVSDHQIITAAHCVLKGGRSSGTLVVSSADGKLWPVISWHVAPDYHQGDISDDIALLQVKEPIGRKLGSLRLYLGDLQDGEDLHVPVRRRGAFRIGHSKASVFKTWFSTDRIVLKFQQIRARPGDSGAPVLRYRKGAYEVVGVLSRCWNGEVVAAYIGKGGHRKTRKFLARRVLDPASAADGGGSTLNRVRRPLRF